MDLETYNLKTTFYHDISLEKKLCENTMKTEWKVLPTFFDSIKKLQENRNINGILHPLLDNDFYLFLIENRSSIEFLIKKIKEESTPFDFTYFGLQTIYSKYLLKTHDGYHESPDYLWLRVSLFIHRNNWDLVYRMVCDLREGKYIHATPTLFNAGLVHHQMASCFQRGTNVLTKKGYIPIEKIDIGMEVWTHKKQWKKVVQFHKNELGSRKVYKIKFKESKPIFVTENHPFYIYNRKTLNEEWIPIGDCKKDTLFVESSLNGNYLESRKFILYGILYSLSFSEKISSRQSNSKIIVRINICKKYTTEFENLVKEFHLFTILSTKKYLIFHTYLIELEEDYLYRSYLQYFLLHINPTYFNSFLKGLSFKYNGLSSYFFRKIYKNDLNLFKNICTIYKYKIISSIFNRKTVHILLSFPKKNNLQGTVRLEYKKEVSISDKYVYTLGVEDDHSYTLDGNIIVQNCFLLGNDDSIRGIYKSIGDCALISKYAGGVGLHCHTIRSNGAYIYGTNGRSNGIIPMLKVYNDTARYVDQGGGKRNGSFAIYLECWHADIFDFLLLKKNVGSEETRARDLFYALWVSDFFMECVQNNSDWFLFDPSVAIDLNIRYGMDFKRLYQKYIIEEKYTKKIKARELWKEICRMQVETGTPYILYKDQCNKLSNQKNLGTIQSSNLCCEIIQYSDHNEYAVCNLASISLSKCLSPNPNIKKIESVEIITKEGCFLCDLAKYFLKENKISYTEIQSKVKSYPQIFINEECIGGFQELWKNYLCPIFNFKELGRITESIVENINEIIDKNMYPLEECKESNLRHRPMGIGVQGLADVFMKLLEPYDSKKSMELNRHIFETMYYYAIKKSIELAKEKGSYSSYKNSPLSEGKFHFELYEKKYPYPFLYNWEELRTELLKYGTRNSLFIALMPTASTSQILGNTESFEPLTSNFYLRRTLTGEYYVMNRILQNILKGLHLWDENMNQQLTLEKGSIQKIHRIPNYLKPIFRTVWEIPQKHCIDMASERQYFIDQSQSMNIYLNNPSIELLTKIHFYGWKKGLKTGSYYIRSRSLTKSQNFFLDAKKEQELQECENCSS